MKRKSRKKPSQGKKVASRRTQQGTAPRTKGLKGTASPSVRKKGSGRQKGHSSGRAGQVDTLPPAVKAGRGASRARLGKPILEHSKVLAWRMRRQLLEKPMLRVPSNLSISLGRTGWMGSPSDGSPYLGLAARYASFARQDLDLALAEQGVLLEVPAVRGRRMVVPVEDGWIALQAYRRAAQPQVDEMVRRRRIATRAELENLGDVIRAVLAGRELTASQIEAKVPAKLVRDLGEKSRSEGFGSTVSVGLWTLMARGDVLVRQGASRLEGNGMRYVLRRDLLGPVEATDFRLRDWQDCLLALTRRYFAWTGMARLGDFSWWAGLTAVEARQGIRAADLVAVKIQDFTADWYLRPEELEDLRGFQVPESPGVALIPAGDCLASPWKSLDALVDSAHWKKFLGRHPRRSPRHGMATGRKHFLVIGGRLVGLWECGPEKTIQYTTFEPLSTSLEEKVARRAAHMDEFISRELKQSRGEHGTGNLHLDLAVGEISLG